ncbi:MAG TPA: hypothetical protein VE990_01555 [Acidimicrobiales bacterium]|nr:hypothetical protein [Acidimicrobiales bacterium]
MFVRDGVGQGGVMARGERAWVGPILVRIGKRAEMERVAREVFEEEVAELIFRLRYPAGGDVTSNESAGASWADVGAALGTTGEAARQRFGARVKALYVEAVQEWADFVSGGGTEGSADFVETMIRGAEEGEV